MDDNTNENSDHMLLHYPCRAVVTAMEPTEYTDTVELKTTFEVSAIYVAYNSGVVKDTVQCSRGFSHMVEFNVL